MKFSAGTAAMVATALVGENTNECDSCKAAMQQFLKLLANDYNMNGSIAEGAMDNYCESSGLGDEEAEKCELLCSCRSVCAIPLRRRGDHHPSHMLIVSLIVLSNGHSQARQSSKAWWI